MRGYDSGMKHAVGHLWQLAFASMPHAALLADRDGRIAIRNLAADRILPPGQQVDQVLQPGGPPDSLSCRQEFEKLEVQECATVRGIWLYRHSGRQFLADVSFCRLCPAEGDGAPQAPEVLILVQDVSERASMERRLAASERLAAVGELSAKVAHELNTPLDGVLRYIGLAERNCPEPAAEMLGRARQGLARMTSIIREMADQGALAAHNSMRARLDQLIQESLSVLQPKIQSRELDVHCDLGEVADRRVDGNLFHVFCNVIVNAMDEMGPAGLLEISAWQSAETIFVDFADNGAGLLAEIPEQIFEPFYTTKAPGSGSGLGLAICRELVDRMGGQIQASNRPTGGARITISLPAADCREPGDE